MAKDYIQGIGHYGITVRNMQESIKWYEDILGFTYFDTLTMKDGSDLLDIPTYAEVTGIPGVKFKISNMRGYGINLEFIEYVYPEGVKIENRPYNIGTSHIALIVTDPEKAYADIKAKGVEVTSDRPVLIMGGSHEGVYANYFKDINGLTLEFCTAPPEGPSC